MSGDPEIKVLVKAPNWVGDAVMSTPAIHRIREAHPSAHLVVMARPWVAPVYENNPDIDRLWTVDDSKSWGAVMSIAREIKIERFEVGIALPNSLRSASLLKFGGVKRRIGYLRGSMRGLFLNQGIKVDPAVLTRHQVYYYLELIREFAGPPPGPVSQTLFPGELEAEEVAVILRNRGLDRGQPLVALAPGAINSEAKLWGSDRFAELADRLTGQCGAAVLLIGSGKESEILTRVEKQCREPVQNLCGEISLGQVIALISRLDGLVTNDAGGMHIAAAFDVPTVAIFGPTEFESTFPFSKAGRIVRKDGVPCAPCMLRDCPVPGHPCMTEVTVDMVAEGFVGILREARGPERSAWAAALASTA